MKIRIYDKKGKTKETIDLEVEGMVEDIQEDLIYQYARVYSLNQRQGTVKTKSRSEVRGGGKKPWKQKGTGRARAGSIRSPIWVGGGVTHGPSPRDWRKKLTNRMNKKVFNDVFLMKNQDDSLAVLSYPSTKDNPFSTKEAQKTIEKAKFKGKILLVHNNDHKIYKSFRNIQGVNVVNIGELCSYDILQSDTTVIEKEAVKVLNKRISS